MLSHNQYLANNSIEILSIPDAQAVKVSGADSVGGLSHGTSSTTPIGTASGSAQDPADILGTVGHYSLSHL